MSAQPEAQPLRIGNQSEAWKHLFRTHPLPIFWVEEDGQILRANPVAQRLFGKKLKEFAPWKLQHICSEKALREKLALASVEGACSFEAPIQILDDKTIQAHWSFIVIGRCPKISIQAVISCEIPPEVDEEIVKNSLAGTLAESRSKQLDRATRQLRLEMIQRTKAETRTEQKKQEVDTVKTKLQERDRQLVQADKMVNLGQMAAGVTHEINNPLTYIKCNLQTFSLYFTLLSQFFAIYHELRDKLETGEDWLESLNLIKSIEKRENLSYIFEDGKSILEDSLQGVLHIEEIVKGIQRFAHKGSESWEMIDTGVLIDEALKIAAPQVQKEHQIFYDHKKTPSVYCHRGQICQVLVNLLVNGLQSMPDGGKLTLSSRAEKESIILEITDTGKGMSQEIQDQIFSPFYTTKDPGVGTGLGLFVSQQIMTKHSGKIEVESEEGKGTTFRLYLPIEAPPVNVSQGHT